MASIPLADVIEKLRDEIGLAMKQAEEKKVRFGLKEIEVELQASVETEAKGGGKFDIGFKVLEISAEGKRNWKKGHVIRLKLDPKEVVISESGQEARKDIELSYTAKAEPTTTSADDDFIE